MKRKSINFVFPLAKIHSRDVMVACDLAVARYINERAVISIWKMTED